jgi:hypothetical protein
MPLIPFNVVGSQSYSKSFNYTLHGSCPYSLVKIDNQIIHIFNTNLHKIMHMMTMQYKSIDCNYETSSSFGSGVE